MNALDGISALFALCFYLSPQGAGIKWYILGFRFCV